MRGAFGPIFALALAVACLGCARPLSADDNGDKVDPAYTVEPAYILEPAPEIVLTYWSALHDSGIDDLWATIETMLDTPLPGELGGARLGLTWLQLIDFYRGKQAFERKFAASEGLGPVFNDVSCGSCHRAPVLGGGGRDMVDGITVHGPPETGGDTMGVRKHAVPGRENEIVRGRTEKLRTPPLYGFGLLDAVPDAAIDANVDEGDRNGDGIIGLRGQRHGTDGKLKPTRFGQKANEWNLRTFMAGALFDEMGVTSTARRHPLPDDDGVADPEVRITFIDALDAYVRNLARPPRAPKTAQSERGKQLFAAIGCVGCHRPTLGNLSGAYTDLLLHDMGPALDSGLKDGVATGRHWRTMPLWGLRFRERFLHDERAASIDSVATMHKGEATKPAAAYLALPQDARADIAAFLRTL